ncbi:hypothetical protein SAMD00023353_0203150 [Rosellinia necatrix]|uniref:Uncharacterized protein n=1 Tax=Rosellinia necatrix TaxID=77044 RepID=A0A1S7UJA4_ROSNE|nr:hypothetical protein SAMD00023353_0203150 [Rosellinia necatrix]
MSKKNKNKNKASHAADAAARIAVVERWEVYMGMGELEDWQRLMKDLGFEEEFPSKTQCRKALKTVWVNIHDFLNAIENGQPVPCFPSQRDLARYTKENGLFYPRRKIRKGSPLRQLLAQIFVNRRQKAHGGNQLTAMMGGLSIAGA